MAGVFSTLEDHKTVLNTIVLKRFFVLVLE